MRKLNGFISKSPETGSMIVPFSSLGPVGNDFRSSTYMWQTMHSFNFHGMSKLAPSLSLIQVALSNCCLVFPNWWKVKFGSGVASN